MVSAASSKIVNWSVRPDRFIFRLLSKFLQTRLHLLDRDLLTVQGSASGKQPRALERPDDHRLEACVSNQFRCQRKRFLIIAGDGNRHRLAGTMGITRQDQVTEGVECAHNTRLRQIFRRSETYAKLPSFFGDFAVPRRDRVTGIENDLTGKLLGIILANLRLSAVGHRNKTGVAERQSITHGAGPCQRSKTVDQLFKILGIA